MNKSKEMMMSRTSSLQFLLKPAGVNKYSLKLLFYEHSTPSVLDKKETYNLVSE